MAHTMSLQDRVNSLGRVASIQPSADILRLFPPKVLTCRSDMPVMQHAETLPESFSSNMFDPSIGDQMMTLNVSETTFDWATAIEGLGDGLFVSDSYDPQWMPSSLEDASHSPSQESSSGTEYTPPLGENDIVCFGMVSYHVSTPKALQMLICVHQLHNVDVKLVGKMQVMYSRLNNSEAVYERFSIKSEDAHVVLRFHDADEQFGYLRTAVAATLSPLLAKPHLEFEPVALTSELLRIIGHASKPADAIVKVDINVYGPSSAGTEMGDALSDGKLWLQKPGHVRAGLAYDNPHFLRIETNSARPQPAEPVRQLTSNGATSRRNREERLRKMVEEVYSSLNRNRQYDAADAGDRVSQKLLRCLFTISFWIKLEWDVC